MSSSHPELITFQTRRLAEKELTIVIELPDW